jgi:hypothetical protein
MSGTELERVEAKDAPHASASGKQKVIFQNPTLDPPRSID